MAERDEKTSVREEDPRAGAELTPVMRQYLACKRESPDGFLFFRMGDFYEMFYDDAREASRILGIALTSRSREPGAPPMAGIPVRSAGTYIRRLLAEGKRIAICEQVGDPKGAAKLLDRKIVRVITPGTFTDEESLEERANHFILAIARAAKSIGLAWIDLSTGEFLINEIADGRSLAAEAARIRPAEVLLPEGIAGPGAALGSALQGIPATPYPEWAFDPDGAARELLDHFRTTTLEGFGVERIGPAVGAAGALIRYLRETQKSSLPHVTRIEVWRSKEVVGLDRAAIRALELTETIRGGERRGSLLGTIDATVTAGGGRLLRAWILAPLREPGAIARRQDAVEEFVEEADLRERVRETLRRISDLERLAGRVSLGTANARDLLALSISLAALPALGALLSDAAPEGLRERLRDLEGFDPLRDLLARAIADDPPPALKDGGMIRDGFDAELDGLRDIGAHGTEWIARFQRSEIERTAIPNLKVCYNRVFGYSIEVTNAHRGKIPPDYVRKQTLKNAERYITPELKEYEAKVLGAAERAKELEYRIFLRLRQEVQESVPALQRAARAVAEIDVVAALAATAAAKGHVRPRIHDGKRIDIREGRHPVVEELVKGEAFVPNDLLLDGDENRVLVITGPNMAGKSTYVRQAAVLVLLGQTGAFIPAASAEIGVVDRVFARVGASDDIAGGQSTFMVEMTEAANILNNATARSLIVLDEVGRGTSTFDGVSIAWAIAEWIHDRIGARTLFATHYHELTELSLIAPGVRNRNVAVKEWRDEIIFLRRIVDGATDKSYGIHVARLAGIPRPVLDRAREILANLEAQALGPGDRPSFAPVREESDDGLIQLDLFGHQNDRVLDQLRELQLDRMTPIEALETLARLQRELL
ncbi:MAG: DNA mismatch repair protein MutS [Planctomycetes bacterium]|nr:DNA mismatch repair protein MutS [Planctomycetota bacterium]